MATTRNDVLISAEDLRRRREAGEKIVLLDVRTADSPRENGLEGAVPVDPAQFAGEGGGLRGNRPLPEIADLQAQARLWGTDDDSLVVLYDDQGNLQAARGWWTLRWAGLAAVRLLDGGLSAGEAAGIALVPLEPAGGPQRGEGQVALSGGHLPVLDADGADEYAKVHVLIDARPAKAFAGDPAERKGGHIPGSVSLPASGNLDAGGRFLPDEALRARFAVATEGRPVGVTCGSGVSAAHNAAALAIIGTDVPLYVGSWSAWSADPSRPVAYGSESASASH